MSGILLLDWAIMAASLFNTILLAWLGLTVVFNSERRDWGVWMATVGLLLGALFFVSHTAIVGLGLNQLSWRNMIFWWTAGLVPAIMLPYAWYIIMLLERAAHAAASAAKSMAQPHNRDAYFWLDSSHGWCFSAGRPLPQP